MEAIESTIEKAYAKLNISLDIVAKRPDGYHDMRMVMQSVSLCDDVSVTLRHDGRISAETNLSYLPNDDRNIAVKTARTFFAKIHQPELGAQIVLNKRIPVCAGMGGGSSDGAAVLRALNRLTEKSLTCAQLEALGAGLGADIPFCVAGGTALAEGKGEILTALPALPDCYIVIAKPRFCISTPELFSKIDLSSVKYHPDTPGILAALREHSLEGVSRRLYNVFETALPAKAADIPAIKAILLDAGALGTAMTGTGSAVFGVFNAAEQANAARATLALRYSEVFLVVPQARLEV